MKDVGNNPAGEARILGRLEEFQKHSNDRFDKIEKKVDGLLEFKWKVTGIAIFVGALAAGVFEVLR